MTDPAPHCLTPEAALEFLRASPLGAELTDEELKVLSGNVCAHEVTSGDYLIEAGTRDDSLHILIDGRLEVVAPSLGSEPVTLHVLTPGDLAGEMSFVDGEPHHVGLRALTECKVVSIERAGFETLVEEHPQLTYKLMRLIVRAAHQIVRRMNLQYVEMTRYYFKSSGRY
jgi:CRP-like cAMP-binding protein